MPIKMHHVALTVRNMNESIDWYKKVFDAEVIERYKKHGLEIAHITFEDIRIELFAGEEVKSLPEYRETVESDIRVIGTKHVCLGTDDLDALVQTLNERGVDGATKIDTAGFGGRYVFIRDRVEFLSSCIKNCNYSRVCTAIVVPCRKALRIHRVRWSTSPDFGSGCGSIQAF